MKQLTAIGLFGLYFAYLLQGSNSALGPAVAGIAENLQMSPGVVAQVGTFGALFGILASFLTGRFAGKIKYKTFIVGSLLIFVVGGCVPMIISNWTVILFSRACVGFGVGVFFALPPALIMKFYTGESQQKNLGIANVFASAGGLIMQFIVGVLVDIKWNYVFSIFAIGIIALALIVFGMAEPEDSPSAQAADDKPKVKAKIPGSAILNFVLIFFGGLFWMPSFLFISIVVVERGLGTGVHAGTVAIMLNVSAIILSFAFGFLYKIFNKFLAIIILLSVTAGMIIEYNATSLVMAGAGMFLVGAFLLMFPVLLSDNGKRLAPESITLAASLLMVAFQTANFLAGPFVSLMESLSGGNPIAGLFFAIFGEAAMVVIFFIIRLVQKDKPQFQAEIA
ncbi:MAG: MFS transporter [Treponema sp.]|jgi:predicted MFS family arabinose efflux permease|nr:MFS transporter [Treponema sp.]